METLKLPVSDFTWVNQNDLKKWTSNDVLKLEAQGDVGYAFEVDLRYPSHLHQARKYKFIFLIF